MTQSIHKYFQIGIIAGMSYPSYGTGPVDVVAKIAHDDYFDAIEINVPAPENRAAVAALLESSHLTVYHSATGRLLAGKLNPNDLDEEGRKRAEDALLEALEEGLCVGSRGMTLLAGKWRRETAGQSYSQLVKTMVNLCRRAKELGLFVELEVFDFDIDKAVLIGPASLAARFAADVRKRCNNFGLMVDLSHFPMCYEDSEYIIRTLRPYITHFHVGNTYIADPSHEAYGDEHPRFGFPGSPNDTPQLLDFLRVLKREGFFNERNPYTLSFEVKPRPYEDCGAVLAGCKRVLNRAWALLED